MPQVLGVHWLLLGSPGPLLKGKLSLLSSLFAALATTATTPATVATPAAVHQIHFVLTWDSPFWSSSSRWLSRSWPNACASSRPFGFARRSNTVTSGTSALE